MRPPPSVRVTLLRESVEKLECELVKLDAYDRRVLLSYLKETSKEGWPERFAPLFDVLHDVVSAASGESI